MKPHTLAKMIVLQILDILFAVCFVLKARFNNHHCDLCELVDRPSRHTHIIMITSSARHWPKLSS